MTYGVKALHRLASSSSAKQSKKKQDSVQIFKMYRLFTTRVSTERTMSIICREMTPMSLFDSFSLNDRIE